MIFGVENECHIHEPWMGATSTHFPFGTAGPRLPDGFPFLRDLALRQVIGIGIYTIASGCVFFSDCHAITTQFLYISPVPFGRFK